MRYHQKFLFAFAISLLASIAAFSKDYELTSPDKKIRIIITVGDDIKWSVFYNREILLNPGSLSMILTNGKQLGISPVVVNAVPRSVSSTITAIVPVRNRMIPDVYNELHLQLAGNYAVCFRAYNDGVAYRFETDLPDDVIEVQNENVELNLGGNYQVFWPREDNPHFQSHFEASFSDTTVADINNSTYGFLPLTFTSSKGTKLVITEADLYDYPNLFFYGTKSTRLTSVFPPVILEKKASGDRGETIIKNANYIAKTSGKRTFPWRVAIISDDKGLLETDMVYKLSSPNVLAKADWIKPGKVAWDWWNDNNVYGVNFRAGINTATYKYYIDFAAEYHLQYIILDEGWSKATTNIMEPAPDLDIKELVQYGKKKNVGVILWALWGVLDKDVDGILDQYAKWGVKGIKVDFMARADQDMVNFYEKIAKATAKRNMLVDFHGAYKPSGLNRKYPNVIGFEGVKGLENDKWSYFITPAHDVTLPFTRMVAGVMDYTPGAMINGTKQDFRPIFSEPMSQGTRAHQVAMYVVYDAPLQMLADNPSNYRKDPACTKFISLIPTVWDKTIGLESKAGQYVAVAKKNGKNWYIGAMTNWDGRELTIPLNFLDGKKYRMELLQDGINADRHGSDYSLVNKEVKAGDVISIKMSSGGGWAAILTPVE